MSLASQCQSLHQINIPSRQAVVPPLAVGSWKKSTLDQKSTANETSPPSTPVRCQKDGKGTKGCTW